MNKKIIMSAVAIVTSFSLGVPGAMIVRNDEAFGKEKTEIDSAVSSVTGAISETNAPISLDGDEVTYVIQGADGAPSKVITSEDGKFNYADLDSYEQPIDVAITYTLDGEKVSADEIAGKSGKVTIHFDYTNNEKQDDYYVPYIVISGAMLDNDVFSNVTVTHGKAVDDGNRTIVGGVAMPGMKYNIDPSGSLSEIQQIPEYIEISADADEFELSMTLSLVMPMDLSDVNLSSFDGYSSIGDDVNALVGAANTLEEGGNKLASGSNELSTGANNLSSGAGAVSSGASSVSTGANALSEGAAELSGGLNTLSSNSESIRNGAAAVFTSLLNNVKTQLTGAGIPVPDLTIDNYATVLDALKAQLESYGPAYAEAAAAVGAAKTQLDSYNTFYAGLNTYTAGVDSAAAGAAEVSEGASALSSGASQVSSGAAQVSSGAKSLSSGAGTLSSGAGTLASGLTQFNSEGMSKLSGLASSDLTNAISRLSHALELAKSAPKTKYIMRSAAISK